jgi:hypothetical protein
MRRHWALALLPLFFAACGTDNVAADPFSTSDAEATRSCRNVRSRWTNTAVNPETGKLTAEADITPSADATNFIFGLAAGPSDWYTDLAAIVRFNSDGHVDARNGGDYEAASTIAYRAGQTYHLRMAVDIQAHTYDAFVSGGDLGEAARTVATAFNFRTEQANVAQLAEVSAVDLETTTRMCNVSVTADDSTQPPPPPPPPPPPAIAGMVGITQDRPTCTKQATTSTFASVVGAASAGDVICLAAGNYGEWGGVSKTITVAAPVGVAARMSLSFNTGDQGMTIDGLTIDGSTILNGAQNITVRNCVFTDYAIFDGLANSNILFDHNNHLGISTCANCASPANLHFAWGSQTHSGVTVSSSLIGDSNADGVQTGCGVNIIGNEFRFVHENGPNDEAHSDPIQIMDGTGSVIRGNYIHDSADGIVGYDGVDHVLIENNVVDLVTGRWGIEIYSDKSSIVRHNTLVYRTTCEYSPCGHIMLDRKSGSPVGTGTQIYDNLAYVIEMSDGSTAARNDHNPSSIGASYVGPQTSWAGFLLTASSPLHGTASDGLDPGITNAAVPTP